MPLPSVRLLEEAYDDSYYGVGSRKFIAPVECVIDYFRGSRARLASNYLRNGDTIIDVGCGNGLFLDHLGRLGNYSRVGVELPGKAADRASKIKGVTVIQGTISDIERDADSVELVTLFHVFEHLTEPIEALKILRKIVKTGGHVIVSFPNIDSWQALFFKELWLHLDPPRHLHLFGPRSFPAIVSDHGFRVIRERFLSFEQDPYGFMQSLLNMLPGAPRDLLYEKLKGNIGYVGKAGVAMDVSHQILGALLLPMGLLETVAASTFRRGATVEYILCRK